MKKSWTSSLEETEANEITADYKAAARLRQRMFDLIESEIRTRAKRSRSSELYSSPNWQLTQADTHGYIRALEFVQSLIKD